MEWKMHCQTASLCYCLALGFSPFSKQILRDYVEHLLLQDACLQDGIVRAWAGLRFVEKERQLLLLSRES